MNATRIGLLVGLLSCVVAAACSAVLGGIEPGNYVAPEAGADGTMGDAPNSGDGGGIPDRKIADRMIVNDVITSGGDGGCPATPDPSKGVFVSVGGDNTSCGSKGTPCKTIAEGLNVAHMKSVPIVYVSAGKYTESITVVGGDHIFGGYAANSFDPICSNPNQAVIIQAPSNSNVTVSGGNLDDAVQIANLTIASKAKADPGETLYGVYVTGGTAALELDDVQISMQAGGDGATGATGDPGADGGSPCPEGGGASADTPGDAGAPASSPGTFNSGGYTPTAGTSGDEGAAGENGAIVVAFTCADCITCKGALCTLTDAGVQCGTQGGSGCGGGPGKGGKGGGGGGSSIGAFFWGGSLKTVGGALTASNGGAGGGGGPGGPGGQGGLGVPGVNKGACSIGPCSGTAVTGCSTGANGSGEGGENGNGGNGSSGGPGGGGSGGSSYALYLGNEGKLVSSVGTTFTVGDAGAGAGDAASGVAKMQGP